MSKQCKLIHSQFCWILEVDGKAIGFQGGDSADYFADHYGALGYEVIYLQEDRNGFRRELE